MMEFFGVYFPEDNESDSGATGGSDLQPVYTDKTECLAAVKKHKGSRFKTFATYDMALQFSKVGENNTESYNGNISKQCGSVSEVSDVLNFEKPSLFRGPSSQDKVKFRKFIEKGNVEAVNELVLNNPRYLVSSGDSPTILKEGSRYNALHVACLASQHDMCAEIFQHISKPCLFQQLYPDDTLETSIFRQQFLLDLYLNTPDKGFNETPLHMACKQGAVICVALLTGYPACERGRVNKYGDTPKDVVCQRYRGSNTEAVKAAIIDLLEPQYFVPVLRDESFTVPPNVGDLWSPSMKDNYSSAQFPGNVLNTSFNLLNMNRQASNTSLNYSQLSKSAPRSTGSGVAALLDSPLTCTRKVHALIGPLSRNKAEKVRQCWRRAARQPQSPVLTPLTSTAPSSRCFTILPQQAEQLSQEFPWSNTTLASTPKGAATPHRPCAGVADGASPRHRDVALPDYEKGLEVLGRQLAEEYNTNWREYWHFLGGFYDLRNCEGKNRLEEHLKTQYAKAVNAEQSKLLSAVHDTLVSLQAAEGSCDHQDPHGVLSANSSAINSGISTSVTDGIAGSNSRDAITCRNDTTIPCSKTDFVTAFTSTKNASSGAPTPGTPNNSSQGSLCCGLAAIKLHASLSSHPSHHSSEADQRYQEVMSVLQSPVECHARDFLQSLNTTRQDTATVDVNMCLREGNLQLLSYVVQSCRVTARSLALGLEEMMHDMHGRLCPPLTIIRAIKRKMTGEIEALHVVITRCCSDNNNEGDVKENGMNEMNRSSIQGTKNNDDKSLNGNMRMSSHDDIDLEKSISETGVSFIHGLVAVETVKVLNENLIPSELLSLYGLLKSLVSHLNLFEITSSDEDEDIDSHYRQLLRTGQSRSDARNQAAHVQCVVSLLHCALRLALDDGRLDKCVRVMSVAELDECACDWGDCSATLAALTQYVIYGNTSRGSTAGATNNGAGRKSNDRYRAAHSFLHTTIFGEKPNKESNSMNGSVTFNKLDNNNFVPNVVKQLSFDDEEGNNLVTKVDVSESDINLEKVLVTSELNCIPCNNISQPDTYLSDDPSNNHQQSPTKASTNGPSTDNNGNNDEDEDDDKDSFATAASTSINSSLATPDEMREVFINGNSTPSKVDLDVLRALSDETGTITIDASHYPYLAQWQLLLQEQLEAAATAPHKTTFDSPFCPKPRRPLLHKVLGSPRL